MNAIIQKINNFDISSDDNPYIHLENFIILLGKLCNFIKINKNNTVTCFENFPIHWDLNKVSDVKGGYSNFIDENEIIEKFSGDYVINSSFKNITSLENPLNSNPNILREFIFSKKNNNKIDEYGMSYSKLNYIFTNYENEQIDIKFFKLLEKCVLDKMPDKFYSGKIILKIKDGKGEKVINNTRPIIMQPIFIKILEYFIIKKNIKSELDKFQLTQKIIGYYGNKIEKAYYELFKDHNENIVTLFFDFKNAYPSIPIEKMANLLYKNNEIDEITYNYIISAYSSAEITYKKTKFKWNYGLIQGSSLSNNLFILYQNVVFKEIFANYFSMIFPDNFNNVLFSKFFITQFVDDTRISLNKSINIKEFCDFFEEAVQEYGFKINNDKTFYIGNYDLKYTNIKDIENPKKYLGSFAYLMNDKSLSILEENVERIINEILEQDWKNNMKIFFWRNYIKKNIDKELTLITMSYKLNMNGIIELLKDTFSSIFIQEYEFFSELEFIKCNYLNYVNYRLNSIVNKINSSNNYSNEYIKVLKDYLNNVSIDDVFNIYVVPSKDEFKNIIKKNKNSFQISNDAYLNNFIENEF